jgi:hypothetical protein
VLPSTDQLIERTTATEKDTPTLGNVLKRLLEQRGLIPVRQAFLPDSAVPPIQTAISQPRKDRLNAPDDAKTLAHRKRFAGA